MDSSKQSSRLRISTDLAYFACLGLNCSNRPVRPRMTGGVAGGGDPSGPPSIPIRKNHNHAKKLNSLMLVIMTISEMLGMDYRGVGLANYCHTSDFAGTTIVKGNGCSIQNRIAMVFVIVFLYIKIY